jgi:Acetyltransferase (GNAT) family
MNMILSRIINDPLLPANCMMEPIRFVTKQIAGSIGAIAEANANALFYRNNKDLIPEPGQTRQMTSRQIVEFQIRDDNRSDRSLFRYDQFKSKFEYDAKEHHCIYTVSLQRDPAYRHYSFKRILLTDKAWGIAKTIFWIAIAILTLPLTLPCAILGGVVRAGRICCGPSLQKRKLFVTVEPACASVCSQIAPIAQRWQDEAFAKKEVAENAHVKEIFSYSTLINRLIKECMKEWEECAWIYDTIFLCRDKALNELQAIALTKKTELISKSRGSLGNHLKIAHLATNPSNIRSSLNRREHNRVEGAATHLINVLAARCLREGCKGIYLESVPSATPFYQRLGFVPLDPHDIIMSEGGCGPMILTAEKIRATLQGLSANRERR